MIQYLDYKNRQWNTPTSYVDYAKFIFFIINFHG